MSAQNSSEDVVNNSVSEQTESSEKVDFQSDLNKSNLQKIKDFIQNSENNQVISEATQSEILQFIESLENQEKIANYFDRQNVIQEIKVFQEKIKDRQVINSQTKKTLIDLIDNLQNVDFTESDYQNATLDME